MLGELLSRNAEPPPPRAPPPRARAAIVLPLSAAAAAGRSRDDMVQRNACACVRAMGLGACRVLGAWDHTACPRWDCTGVRVVLRGRAAAARRDARRTARGSARARAAAAAAAPLLPRSAAPLRPPDSAHTPQYMRDKSARPAAAAEPAAPRRCHVLTSSCAGRERRPRLPFRRTAWLPLAQMVCGTGGIAREGSARAQHARQASRGAAAAAPPTPARGVDAADLAWAEERVGGGRAKLPPAVAADSAGAGLGWRTHTHTTGADTRMGSAGGGVEHTKALHNTHGCTPHRPRAAARPPSAPAQAEHTHTPPPHAPVVVAGAQQPLLLGACERRAAVAPAAPGPPRSWERTRRRGAGAGQRERPKTARERAGRHASENASEAKRTPVDADAHVRAVCRRPSAAEREVRVRPGQRAGRGGQQATPASAAQTARRPLRESEERRARPFGRGKRTPLQPSAR